jgi:hypothetical protein
VSEMVVELLTKDRAELNAMGWTGWFAVKAM